MTTLATLVAASFLTNPLQAAAEPSAKQPKQTIPAAKITAAPAEAPQAAAPELKPLGIGDAAPALQYDEWVKGDKVSSIEKGKVHVIEFWATWCGPCIAVMPHLSEIQKKFPEVVIVSVAASERGKDEATKIAKVKDFVTNKGDTMSYRIAYVGDRAKMSRPWMEAAGQNGIPCSFIVDKDSNIAWIGHPSNMDAPLAAVVAGTWNPADAKRELEEERAAMQAQRALSKTMRDARTSGDYGPAITALEAMIAKTPSAALKMQLMGILAGPAGNPAKAWVLGEEIFAENQTSPAMMNALAWMIVDPEGGVKEPNLDLAMKAAEAAVANSKATEGAMLDTLARVVFCKGDVDRAIELQKRALEKTPAGAMKESMQKTLDEYETSRKKA